MSDSTAENENNTNTSGEKQAVNEKSLDEKLEKLVEEKVEKRVEERVQEELEKRGVEDQNAESQEESNEEDNGVSRRNFLKKIGAGAIGLGALSLSPASALNMRSNDFTFYGADNTEEFQINDGGPVEVRNADLNLNQGWLKGVSNIRWRPSGYPDSDSWTRYTQGGNDGDEKITMTYVDSSAGGYSDHMVINRGGPFDLSQVNQDLRLPTGNSIEDGSGTARFGMTSGRTTMRYTNGDLAFNANDTHGIRLHARSDNLRIRDDVGSFDAVSYFASSSAPGTLELTNADLNMNSNAIKNIDWTNSDDGSGSGLDADTVDGKEASDLSGGKKIQRDVSGAAITVGTSRSGYGVGGKTNSTEMLSWDNHTVKAKTNGFSGTVYASGTASNHYTGTGSNSGTVTIEIRKNGSKLTGSNNSFGVIDGSDSGSVSTSTTTGVTSNDTITFWMDGGVTGTMTVKGTVAGDFGFTASPNGTKAPAWFDYQGNVTFSTVRYDGRNLMNYATSEHLLGSVTSNTGVYLSGHVTTPTTTTVQGTFIEGQYT